MLLHLNALPAHSWATSHGLVFTWRVESLVEFLFCCGTFSARVLMQSYCIPILYSIYEFLYVETPNEITLVRVYHDLHNILKNKAVKAFKSSSLN